MDQLEKVGKKLLGSQIEDSLMEYILNEPVAIGEKLPNEFELAEKFGVGRSTIREAVKSLVSKGVLEVRRGSGTYVVSTSSLEEDPLGLGRFEDKYHLALELFEVRLMLEPEICSHFNDSGFWLVKSLVGMDEKTTLKTWTIMETLVGGTGFLVAMIISFFA